MQAFDSKWNKIECFQLETILSNSNSKMGEIVESHLLKFCCESFYSIKINYKIVDGKMQEDAFSTKNHKHTQSISTFTREITINLRLGFNRIENVMTCQYCITLQKLLDFLVKLLT